jgi:hypothetical protein
VKGTKTQTSKKEGKTQTSKKEGRQRKFRSTWGERECKRKMMGDLDVGTRREKTGIGWKEGKEGAECAMKRERQLSTCGIDVAKCEKGRQKGDKMDERDMEEEGKERK